MEVGWSCGTTFANLKIVVAVIWILDDWRCRRKHFQSIGSRLCLMPRFRSSLLWFLGALCSFIFARMRVGLNTQLRTCGCIAQFWWHRFLGRFAQTMTMQTCKGLLFFKRTFFLPRAVRMASESTEKCVQKYGNIMKYPSSLDPSEPKGHFSENAPFFHGPSVHQSKLCQQLAPQGQGQWMCSIPVCIFQKCRNVQMFAPAAGFYISTQIVDPKLFCQEVSVIRSEIEQKGALLVKHFVELGELVTKRTVTCFVARVDFPLFFSPKRCFPCLKGWCPLPW